MSTAPPSLSPRPALILVVKAIDKRSKGQIADMFGEEPSASGMQTGEQDDFLPRGGSHSFPAPAARRTPPSTSLFSEPASAPVQPSVQPNASARVQTDAASGGMPRKGSGRFRGLPKMKEAVHALSPLGLGGLFDETVHPRAGTGATTINPETGKIIQGGQFAPNPLAASRRFRDKKKPAEESGDLFGEENQSADSAASGAVGTRVSGELEAERSGAVQVAGNGGQADQSGARGGKSGDQDDAVAHSEATNDSGARPATGVDDVHSRPGTGNNADFVAPPGPTSLVANADSPALPLMGTLSGVGYQSPVKTGNDYRISDEDAVGGGNARQKFEANLAALRVLHDLQPITDGVRQAKGRDATPEEQAILVKYSGWGWGSQKAFDTYNPDPVWRDLQAQLRPLLTDREYNEARASTDNAHYTAPGVIRNLWEAARHLGFSGGKWLEPAAGVGHFNGLMPSDLWANSKSAMVEIDPLSAAITGHLYQSAKTFAAGFQDAPLPDKYFDLAISNVPFGNVKVTDTAFLSSGRRAMTRTLHDYFFAKALDKVRPGGGIIFITSTGTMDKNDSRVRQYLSDNAELVGAIRLPKDTFAGNAGTDVTTDVLFLRKRSGEETEKGEAWTGMGTVDGPNGEKIPVNEYFARHPEMMLGKMALTGTRFRSDAPELLPDGRELGAAMQEAIAKLPAGVLAPAAPATQNPIDESLEAQDWGRLRVGSYHVDAASGNLLYRSDKGLVPADMGLKQQRIVRGYVKVRDAMHVAYDTMLSPDSSDEQVASAQRELGSAYDAFTSANGPLHSPDAIAALTADPDLGTVMGLEKYTPKYEVNAATGRKKLVGSTVEKTEVFTKRTLIPVKKIDRVDNPNDALQVSLSETGKIDFDRMASLTNSTPEAIRDHFLAQGKIYENPEGDWETHDAYLSGNVRKKLKAAQAVAALDPRYQRNVDALTPIIPEDRTPGWITPNLGASWIPASDVARFAGELMDFHPSRLSLTYNEQNAKWHNSDRALRSLPKVSAWGAGSYSGTQILDFALNDKKPVEFKTERRQNMETGRMEEVRVVDSPTTAAVHDKIEQIRDAFRGWIWQDEERSKRLLGVYNETFNGHVLRAYDGQHLSLPGLSAFGQANLRPFVKDTVWRILQSPSTMLAHEMGSGKSWCYSAACMEMRRLGTSRKPMVVVPNDLVANQQREHLKMYPNAKLLVYDKEVHGGPAGRQQFLAQIAGGDWDAVIVPQSVYTRIPMSMQARIDHVQSQIDDMDAVITSAIEDARDNGDDPKRDANVKDLSKSRDNFVAKMQELLHQSEQHKDEGLTFEKLGVDALLVDEAHGYKNLPIATRLQKIKGITGAAGTSQRANDMEMKIRHIQSMGNGSGRVVMATGTPIVNTMCEAYVYQKLLDPQGLQDAGLSHFDAWAKAFGVVEHNLEKTATNEVKGVDRFSKFVNVGDLVKMFHKVAEVKTRLDLGIKGPKVDDVAVTCPQSEAQTEYVKELAERAKNIRRDTMHLDNMLKINTDGKKNSLDFRLIDPTAPDHAGSKVSKCAEHVFNEWEAGHANKLTQLIFCDMGTPKKEASSRAGGGAAGRRVGTAAAAENDGDETGTPGEDEQDETLSDADRQHVARLYDDIKARLVARGIPEHEVAFIQHFDTNEKKRQLQEDMNAGKIRVLVGSRTKMATGLNVQQRAVAVHDLDVPDTPASLMQGRARADRPGNENDTVRAYKYVSNSPTGSYDAVSWDRIRRKQMFIDQFMSGDPNMSEMEDISTNALNASEWASLAEGKPELFEHAKVKSEVDKLEASRRGHEQEMHYLQSQIHSAKQKAEKTQGQLPYFERLSAWRAQNKPEKFVAHLSDGRVLDKAGDFADLVLHQAAGIAPGEERHLGDYGGFRISLKAQSGTGGGFAQAATPVLEMTPLWGAAHRGDDDGDVTLTCPVPDAASGVVPAIYAALNRPELSRAQMQKEIDDTPTRVAAYEGSIKPWPKADELAVKKTRKKELEQIITGKADEPVKEGEGAAPVVKGVGRFRSRVSKGFDGEAHPRAGAGGSVSNPATGKTSKGGEFATKGSDASFSAATQTDSDAFKRWFGNSKVVDDNGKPLVVYHGTDQEFDVFDKNAEPRSFEEDRGKFFFTSNKGEAKSYANGTAHLGFDNETGGRVISAYVSLQNPYIETFEGTKSPDEYLEQNWALNGFKDYGHDGLIIHNMDTGERLVVAIEPTQIKSATGNSGAFNPSAPNIHKSVGRFRSRIVKAGSSLVDSALNLPGRVNQTARSRRGNYHGLSVDESDRYDALTSELSRKKDAKRTGPSAKEFAGLHARRVASVPAPAQTEKPSGMASASPIPSGARRFRDTGGDTVARMKPERRAETKPTPSSYSSEDYSGNFSRKGGSWSGSAAGVNGGRRFRGGGPPAQKWLNDSPAPSPATTVASESASGAQAGRGRFTAPRSASNTTPPPAPAASPATSVPSPASSAPGIDMNHLAATHKMTIADTQSKSEGGQARQAHLLTHRTPQVAAVNLYRTLRSTGHNLSGVTTNRSLVDGHMRHVYSFHFQHGSGSGPIHTVNVVRPRKADVIDVPRATAAPKPARKFKPGASGGVGFVPRRTSGTAR